MPDQHSAESPQAAIARYHAAIERAVRALVPLDAGATTLTLTADAAERFADMLANSAGGLWGYVSGSGSAAARGLFVLGLAESAPGLRVSQSGDTVEAIFVAPRTFEGPDGAMHGGQVANLFDELCALAQSIATDTRGRTASLAVIYHRPVPLELPLMARARVTGIEGRKITVEATISHGETLCASAEALFVRPAS